MIMEWFIFFVSFVSSVFCLIFFPKGSCAFQPGLSPPCLSDSAALLYILFIFISFIICYLLCIIYYLLFIIYYHMISVRW
ncbi:hypothetical protein T492DRAFT_530933 [Pavlovales sp. CCMP2436]|nr:hypothetical protein T492DRAFT_530933 [Pavlovales sp. CCMP2436]